MPRSVTEDPPSLVILPPEIAVAKLIADTSEVLIVAKTGAGVEDVFLQEIKEHPIEPISNILHSELRIAGICLNN